ncbi:MAG: hypothetical protein NTU80_04305 [Verrucomicrobia bacterium]|nr:hypothetical protein [Verrucomicrobiota bacterium]
MAELEGARALSEFVRLYNTYVSPDPVTTWEQLAQVDPYLTSTNLYFRANKAWEVFTFIPIADRGKFPEGNLILVQVESMPWPNEWKKPDPNHKGKYLQHASHLPIRLLVYKSAGELRAEYWPESKFQAMLAETGLTIPPPSPYHLLPANLPGEKPAATSSPAVPVIATETAPALAPSATPTPTTAQVAPPSAKSSSIIWWIIGAIAALAAVVLTLRRKKPNV